MGYDVEYDSVLGCYCLHYAGEIVCLGSETRNEAAEEASLVVEQWLNKEMFFDRQKIVFRQDPVDIGTILNGATPKQVIEQVETLYDDAWLDSVKEGNPMLADCRFMVEWYGYDGGFEVYLNHYRWETDEEMEHRIASESHWRMRKASREEERERREYERLRAKFEK